MEACFYCGEVKEIAEVVIDLPLCQECRVRVFGDHDLLMNPNEAVKSEGGVAVFVCPRRRGRKPKVFSVEAISEIVAEAEAEGREAGEDLEAVEWFLSAKA